MKKRWKSALSVLVAALLAASMTGCNQNISDSSQQGDAGQQENEVVTLSGFVAYSGNQGAIDKAVWFTDYLRDNLGIELQFQDGAGVGGSALIQTLMAGGELPDIVGFDDATQMQTAVQAGLLLNLDDYQEYMPNIYENDTFKDAITYSRENRSAGQEGLYILPTEVGVRDSINYNPHLRWDIYKQVGSPEIGTLEDYLDVLKQMQDAYPQTEDGSKVYGLSLFGDWDNYTMGMAAYMASLYGVDLEYVNQMCETPVDGSGQPESILRDDSVYKRILKFFFDANQMGILDPDSVTQNWETVSSKYNNGQILFSPWEWAITGYNTLEKTDVDSFTGYAPVWADDFQIPIRQDSYASGSNWCLAIGSATEQPEAAAKFMNFLYSFECQDLIMNGPEGVLWEVGDDGKRAITDVGWDIIENGKELPGGGTLGDAAGIINSPTITMFTENPEYPGQTMSYQYWESSILHKDTKLLKDWRESYDGAVDVLTWAKDNNKVVKSTAALSMMPGVPDELSNTMAQIGDVVKTNSWKMVLAADETEFESLWKEMQDKATALGMDQVVDWARESFATAKQNADKYSK